MVISQRRRLEQAITTLIHQIKTLEVRGRGEWGPGDPAAEKIFRKLTEARRELQELRPE